MVVQVDKISPIHGALKRAALPVDRFDQRALSTRLAYHAYDPLAITHQRANGRALDLPTSFSGRAHRDARIYAGLFDGDEAASMAISPWRRVYPHIARGVVTANGIALKAGNALKLVDETQIDLVQGQQAEVLLFDLPK